MSFPILNHRYSICLSVEFRNVCYLDRRIVSENWIETGYTFSYLLLNHAETRVDYGYGPPHLAPQSLRRYGIPSFWKSLGSFSSLEVCIDIVVVVADAESIRVGVARGGRSCQS